MKLKRYIALADFPERQSRGIWNSADGVWLFFCLGAKGVGRPGWSITTRRSNGEDGAVYKQRETLLKQSGLWDASFKTRREAVAALELVIASAAEGQA